MDSLAMASRAPLSSPSSLACPLPRLISMPSCCRAPCPAPLLQLMRKSNLPCRTQASGGGGGGGGGGGAAAAITFHVENTSITVPMSQAAARGVGKAIGGLLTTFKEKAKAERPRRWESMEFRHSEDGVSLELFCNPNAYANAFQAKILLTIGDEKIKIASEGQLSAIKADIDQYVEAYV